MKQKLQNTQRGITLVALIITIIVLLILAMVSISLVMNSGIIDKSKTAVDKYSQEEIQEQIKLAYAEWQTAQWTSDAGDAATFMQTRLRTALNDNGLTVTGSNGIFVAKLSNNKQYIYDSKAGGMLDEVPISAYPEATPGQANNNENTKYTSNNKTAVIPKEYTLDATQNSIDNGLVISKDGNEWVWIPVANVTDLYTENTTNQEWILCGTSGDSKVVSQYASKARTDVESNLTRTTPGNTSSFREPDVLNNDSYDKNTTNLSNAGLGANIGEAATKLRDDYKAMIESVRKNGGFYVGRYELGGSVASPKVQYQQTVLTDTNWYNLYKACKDIDSSGVVTAMIWGCQWDQVCKFINTSGDKVSLTNSTSYGNYKNSTVAGHGSKKVTGYSESWKANNIYDLAGNCLEWTQEAYSTDFRAGRGGSYYYNGDGSPVACRGYDYPTYTNNGVSSRPVLYLK